MKNSTVHAIADKLATEFPDWSVRSLPGGYIEARPPRGAERWPGLPDLPITQPE